MNEKKLQPGDVVQLKTGGPSMTVDCYINTLIQRDGLVADGPQVQCVWFEKGPTHAALAMATDVPTTKWEGPHYGAFHEDSLVKVAP